MKLKLVPLAAFLALGSNVRAQSSTELKSKTLSMAALIALTFASRSSHAVWGITGQWGSDKAPDGIRTMSCFE